MATDRSAAMGTLASGTNAPRSTARPPRSSTRMVNHAIKCGAGTPSACRIATKASGPLDSLAAPCCMKPNPTTKRSGMGAQRAIGNRLDQSSAASRYVIMGGHLDSLGSPAVGGRLPADDDHLSPGFTGLHDAMRFANLLEAEDA